MENILQQKETINGKTYPDKTGYVPSKEYLEFYREQKEAIIRIKEKKEYAQIVETESLIIYRATINNIRQKAADLYGRFTYLADDKLGNIFQQIKNIMETTKTKVSEMIKDLRNFLGYNFSPNRYENGKITPIEPNKIQQAWEMLKNKSNNFIAVENVLMFS